MNKNLIEHMVHRRMICANCKSRNCNCGNTYWVLPADRVIDLIDDIVN